MTSCFLSRLARLRGYVAPLSLDGFFPLAFGPFGTLSCGAMLERDAIFDRGPLIGFRTSGAIVRRQAEWGALLFLNDAGQPRGFPQLSCHSSIECFLVSKDVGNRISIQFDPHTPPAPFLTSSRLPAGPHRWRVQDGTITALWGMSIFTSRPRVVQRSHPDIDFATEYPAPDRSPARGCRPDMAFPL